MNRIIVLYVRYTKKMTIFTHYCFFKKSELCMRRLTLEVCLVFGKALFGRFYTIGAINEGESLFGELTSEDTL